jgi:hypothetical protein
VLVDQHAERTRALETARLATTETTVSRAQGEIHGELSRAEERGDRERAAARERADAVLAAARSRASASPDLPVMRQEDPGGSGAPDLTQVLAGAEREAADTIAAAEALIAQMIEAARMQADGRVAALAAEIEQLLTELETELADVNAQLDLAMPLVGERFRTQIQGVLASVRSEVHAVQYAARTGDVVILDEMERELAASATAHQAQIADIFDDVGHDWRIVEAAEQISARCRAGDCFERGPDGEYLTDENGNLIPNISAGEYMLLFEAAEIQTGIPARLLKAIAEGEAISGVHRDGVPRQFYDGSAISGQATMDGMARWAPEFFSELTDEAIPPVIWGDDSQVDNDGDGVPDGPDTRGIGWMQLTTGADAIRTAWSSGQGTINIAGVEVDLRLAISDPYYNLLMAGAVLRQKQQDFSDRDWVSQDPQTDMDWALIGSLFQTRGGNGPINTETGEGGATQRIFNRMELTEEELAAIRAGDAGRLVYYNWDANGDGKVDLDDNNQPLRDSAVSNAELVIPSDRDVPIPEDLYLIGGELYQLSDHGGREDGMIPVAAGTTIAMDGRYYQFIDGDLVEVPAPPADSEVVETRPLGETP